MSSSDYIIIENDDQENDESFDSSSMRSPTLLEKEGIFLEDESQAPLGDISSSDLASELNDISGIEIVPHESGDESSEL